MRDFDPTDSSTVSSRQGVYPVCTIGGGSGMPVVNRALIRAGYSDIRSIVTTFDSGGDTGRMRTDERGQILAYSDYWRSLMSLWRDGEHKLAWGEMLRFRDDLGRSFGNTFLRFLVDKTRDLRTVDTAFMELTGAQLHGQVVPVSLQPSELCFRTESGRVYCGEHHLDELRMSSDRVQEIWLGPPVPASDEALAALANAGLIVVAPGSLYGSILVNFLPEGMREAFVTSKGYKVLVVNIVSSANETGRCQHSDYVACFQRQLGVAEPFDLILMADLSALNPERVREAARYYAMEQAFPIGYDAGQPQRCQLADVALIEGTYGRLRHCEQKLGRFFASLTIPAANASTDAAAQARHVANEPPA